MALSALIEQLKSIGRMLNRWRAEFRLTAGFAVLCALLFVLALTDIFMRYSRGGRIAAWGMIVVPGIVLAVAVAKTLLHHRTPEAVAASVEKCFPVLDNHLINFLQFSSVNVKNAFISAYVKMDIPHWNNLDFKEMKDARTLRHARLAFCVAVVLLLLPMPFLGRAWNIAVIRVLNPFSDLAPVCLTRIVSVSPGDARVIQGGDITLAGRIQGKAGHDVLLDVRPTDGEEETYNLGTLKGEGEEIFQYALVKVTSATKYRFRAGDAYVKGWNEISVRPPLAFDKVSIKVQPPAYTGISVAEYDAQKKSIEIPYGSQVSLSAACNTALRNLSLSVAGHSEDLFPDGSAAGGSFDLVVTNGAAFTLGAVDIYGGKTETEIGFDMLRDNPPVLTVNYPQRSVPLPPGRAPVIDFTATDDFGFREITVERQTDDENKSGSFSVLKRLTREESRGREVTCRWKGDIRRVSDKGRLIFRVVARDNREGAENVTVSPALIFELDESSEAAEQREKNAEKSAAGLTKVIEMQRENIVKTRQLQTVAHTATREEWISASVQQERIRKVIKVLIEKGGARTLGNLVPTVKKLYVNEMYELIPFLRSVPEIKNSVVKKERIAESILMQEKILRQLTAAGKSAAIARSDKSTSSLRGILDGLINSQSKIIKTTSRCATQGVEVAMSVIDDQDALSSDVFAFIRVCREQALAGQGGDKDQGAFLNSVVSFFEKQRIADDMLLAAEQLEENVLNKALAYERSARDKLQKVRSQFEEVKAGEEKEVREEMIDALQVASAKLKKLKSIEKKLHEEMDKIEEISNANTEDFDIMEEEATEIKENIKEALQQIPADLDIFTHLNVGNDLVEDVYSVFEELEEKENSGEKNPDGTSPVEEQAVAKREWYLDEMEKAEELIEDFEMWLGKDADTTKVTTEAFDKEEMPESVALTPLQSSMEDIIGDLLDIDDELDEEADDGAVNQALPDLEMGAEITEGDTTTFSAKGKSGNETPDHKEQDGRSIVGRQGMASGESAAGSGTISEGDDNIEARRTKDSTQSGQVMADGEADTKATGGGKLGSGKGDDWGDSGGTDRMDSSEAGSWAQSLENMARKTDQAYAQASLKGLRTDSLESAAHHIRQASDAVSRGVPIKQVAELRRKAIGALKKAKTELGEEAVGNLDGQSLSSSISDVIEAGRELSPKKYKELNADYYKKLNDVM
ncbi:MAG: hypothetical protein R6V06_09760 [Kiritimatiellia bacterium]